MMTRTPPPPAVSERAARLERRNLRKSTSCHNEDTMANQQDDTLLPPPPDTQGGSTVTSISNHSSLARRKQIELETAQMQAEIDLEVLQAKSAAAAAVAVAKAEAQTELALAQAEIKKKLLEKRMAAEMAALSVSGSHSARSSRRISDWVQATNTAQAVDKPVDSNVPEVRDYASHHHRYHEDISKLADALRDAVVMTASTSKSNNQELLTRLATSKDLPLFFGESMEWLQFKESYNESTRLCHYSDSENIWRLRKCLRGPAKEAVSSLLIGNTSPQSILDTLELRFGRPETIMVKIVAQLKKLPPLPQSYHGELVNFALKIQNYVAAASALKQDDYLRSPELVNIILCKLPVTLVTKWADYSYECDQTTKIPRLELISSFLHHEARKAAAAGTSHLQMQLEPRRKIEERRPQTVLLTTTRFSENKTRKCKFCRSETPHALEKCSKFKRALRRDRWRFARNSNLCYKCLNPQHDDDTACTAPDCDIDGCGGPHHRLLHWTKKPQGEQSQASEQRPRETVAACSTADEPDEEGASEIVAHAAVVAEELPTQRASKVLLKVVPITVTGPLGSINTHALLDDGATVTLIAADLATTLGVHGESVTMRARSAWDSAELVCATEMVSFAVENSVVGQKYEISARKMRELNLPPQKVPTILENMDNGTITFSFGSNNNCIQPQLLIGQDNFNLIAPLVCIRDNDSDTYYTKTLLGWCIHGNVCSSNVTADRIITPPPFESRQCDCVFYGDNNPILTISFQQTGSICLFSETSHEDQSEAAAAVAAAAAASACASCCPRPPDYDDGGALTDAISCNDDCVGKHLHDLVRHSFSLDSIGIIPKPRKNPEHERAIAILDRTSQLIDGAWVVGLPWKSDDVAMPVSYFHALSRLNSIEKKMSTNEQFAGRYRDRIKHLFENNFAREVGVDELAMSKKNRIWYLPHFGVDNPNKSKLRLVFDAAAKSKGLSLNSFLLQGPDLLQSLLGIMFRFRENPVGIIGDIKDMFLRIKVQEDDQSALRFLWRDNDQIKTYCMTSLIFGANCSPFVAQYINQFKNAERFRSTHSNAVHAIQKNQYMDNYIDSLPDASSAIQMVRDISHINNQGSFFMCSWMSNDKQVVESTPKEALSATAAVKINVECQVERTLGLLWYPSTDTFGFDLSLKKVSKDVRELKRKPTKRELLCIVMSIFDMHGFLAPLTVQGKIILQKCWKLDLGWDTEIPDELFTLFTSYFIKIKAVDKIRIPRWYLQNKKPDLVPATKKQPVTELHVFCDASPSAYAAVAYWRTIHADNTISISFIASKNRVTPLKVTTIPRLELQGALLACRLADTIRKEHRIVPIATYFWTDSTIVLYWIKNQTKKYKIFISHRLGEIDTLSEVSQWHYVPTSLNIADIATKINNYELNSSCPWFSGPSFLNDNSEQWQITPEPEIENIINDNSLEVVNTINIVKCDLPVPDTNRFSSWLRLVRCMSFVLVFIRKCKKLPGQLSCYDMEQAEKLIIRQAQQECFASDISLLKQGQSLDKSSRLLQLTPFLDENELLRVGGRINAAAGVSSAVKQPLILDGKHPVSKLIVKHYHVQAAHGHNESVVNELRQKYWLLKLRPTVRNIASSCNFCRNRKARPEPPRLGDLPAARLHHHARPFTSCGVDLFGPMDITVGRKRDVRYGVVFTCLTVRAVHIEVVPSLTADSLIMALRRMAARRGWPTVMFSDNGTNLRGADAELKRSFADLHQKGVAEAALNRGIEWRFISPVSPHMAGAWERLIRTIKTALKVVLKERAPREEVLLTLLAEVENIVNSRPLSHVSVDPRSEESLTPNHFLLGNSSNLPIPGSFDDGELCSRRQWRIAQRLTDLFWNRWMKEVLPTLIPRQKWCSEGVQLKEGDVVVVVDPASPRNSWPKGIIDKVYPGGDGRVRVVDVRTKTGVMKRPAARIALLVRSECHSDTGAQNVGDGLTFL